MLAGWLSSDGFTRGLGDRDPRPLAVAGAIEAAPGLAALTSGGNRACPATGGGAGLGAGEDINKFFGGLCLGADVEALEPGRAIPAA